MANAAEAATVSALAAETAAFAAFTIATAEPAKASAAALSSTAAFPPAAFTAARAAPAVPSAGSTPHSPVSTWCGIRVHKHLLQLLWLVQQLRQLLREHEQPPLRRRRAWVAVLMLLSRHRLHRLRPARHVPTAITALAPPTVPNISATTLAPTAAIATAEAAAATLAAAAAQLDAESGDSAISAFAAKVSTSAAAATASAAAVPLPTGYWCPVHQHVFCLLLRWVLRTLHVLLGPKC